MHRCTYTSLWKRSGLFFLPICSKYAVFLIFLTILNICVHMYTSFFTTNVTFNTLDWASVFNCGGPSIDSWGTPDIVSNFPNLSKRESYCNIYIIHLESYQHFPLIHIFLFPYCVTSSHLFVSRTHIPDISSLSYTRACWPKLSLPRKPRKGDSLH